MESNCIGMTQHWPMIIFWISVMVTSIITARTYQLSIKETLLVMFGIRKVRLTPMIISFYVFTVIVPLTLWTYLIASCKEQIIG
ncbi:hypothetical protein RCCS2_06709 [Roseobacter sp. CCS2]|nr:hypothetical protein RCCS2_06709 [Roseobacter sp. CCS2]